MVCGWAQSHVAREAVVSLWLVAIAAQPSGATVPRAAPPSAPVQRPVGPLASLWFRHGCSLHGHHCMDACDSVREGRLEPRNWKWNGGQQGSGAGGSQWRGGAGRSCRPHAGQQCTPRAACKCRRHIACPPSSCRRTVAFMITVLPNPRTQCYSRSFPQVPDGAWPLGSSQLGLHVLRRSDVFLGYFAVSLLGNCSPGWLQ